MGLSHSSFYCSLLLFLLINLGACFYKKEQVSNEGEVVSVKLNRANENRKIRDARDGQVYTWVELTDGKKWMNQNLNYKMTDSWCYEDKEINCKKYGRLYTWAAANKACPKGWRLPSDDEWWNMTSKYGKTYNSREGKPINTEDNAGKAAYKALLQYDSNSFSVVLGGTYFTSDGNCFYLDKHGYYWSDTEINKDEAWYYDFNSFHSGLYRINSIKSAGYSCRCIAD